MKLLQKLEPSILSLDHYYYSQRERTARVGLNSEEGQEVAEASGVVCHPGAEDRGSRRRLPKDEARKGPKELISLLGLTRRKLESYCLDSNGVCDGLRHKVLLESALRNHYKSPKSHHLRAGDADENERFLGQINAEPLNGAAKGCQQWSQGVHASSQMVSLSGSGSESPRKRVLERKEVSRESSEWKRTAKRLKPTVLYGNCLEEEDMEMMDMIVSQDSEELYSELSDLTSFFHKLKTHL